MKAYINVNDVDKAESLFREMNEAYGETENEEYEPTIDAYNVLIRATGMRDNNDGPQKAEKILFELMERFRNGENNLKPNIETFRNVLSAYNTNNKNDNKNKKRQQLPSSSAAKIDRLLQIQEGFFAVNKDDSDDDDENYEPDGRLYSTALNIISRSNDSKKAVKAKQVFDRYQKIANEAGGDPTQFMESMYRSILSACAYTRGDTPEENFEAFQIALGVLKELRTHPNLTFNSSSAGLFLKCTNLMPEGTKRDDLIKGVFEDCCKRGIVNEFVIDALDGAASDKLQLELVGGFISDGVRIRKDWARNATR